MSERSELPARRVLVAGIGNIFLGDDGWGVEVVDRLTRRPQLEGVRIVDFGIRGVHLAYEVLDGYDVVVLVDAVPMGEVPGTIAVLEPEMPDSFPDGDNPVPFVDAHSMSPDAVLGMLAGLGARVSRILVVGCEPATLDQGIGLSDSVAASVDGAVELCSQLVDEIVRPVAKETLS